mmetsp:Transcript_16540/g.42377  ORF Transcript_16540/g.42377 Transcript_16540/m.42377 type:complete len:363 (-) Transcript_16540:35-1123(-)
MAPTPEASVVSAASVNELPVDESNRLSSHMLLLGPGSKVKAATAQDYQRVHTELQVVVASGELAALLPENEDDNIMSVGCLERGLPQGLVSADTLVHPAAIQATDAASLEKWIRSNCAAVEVGFINYMAVEVELLWVSSTGAMSHQAHLPPRCKISILGSECIHWRSTFVGHRFQMRPNQLGVEPVTITAAFSGVHTIGEPAPIAYERSHQNWTRIAEVTAANERRRATKVQKTFTEMGFDRAPIPEATWAGMSTYYYNNRYMGQREDWDQLFEVAFVNWWDSPTRVIPMPHGLKSKWHRAMMPLVSSWAGGVALEPTALYGMRIYSDGSWLNRQVTPAPPELCGRAAVNRARHALSCNPSL